MNASFDSLDSAPWGQIDADLFQFSTTSLRDLHLALMLAVDHAAVLSPALLVDKRSTSARIRLPSTAETGQAIKTLISTPALIQRSFFSITTSAHQREQRVNSPW